jgi:broad specificity phosphatase PhoE
MGQLDVPLDERGLAQAGAAAALLTGRGIAGLYSSDLRRAWQTALVVSRALDLVAQAHAGLREQAMGRWEGLTRAEIDREVGAMRAEPHVPPGGEAFGEMSCRVWAALEEISLRHPGQEVLTVTHGGPLRAIALRILGLGWERRGLLTFENCGLMALEPSADGWRMVVPGPA